MMTYAFILKGIEKMDFPKKITKRPEDLIRKLCRYRSGWEMLLKLKAEETVSSSAPQAKPCRATGQPEKWNH